MAAAGSLPMEATSVAVRAALRPLPTGGDKLFGEQVALQGAQRSKTCTALSSAEPLLPRIRSVRRGRQWAFAQGENGSTDSGDSPSQPVSQSSISELMSDVSNLVKLVDSTDIVELELKQKEYEVVIRKETSQPVPSPLTSPGPHVMAHTSFPGYAQAPSPPSSAQVVAVAEPPSRAVAPAPPPAPLKPSCPPMLSPMAGTFYRSPAPGVPAFVQVGDKVTKGQVVCIVEAMKLMNEIEADQSGTIVEILAEDGKPISIESPLFLIEP